jgi:hypothetical protein
MNTDHGGLERSVGAFPGIQMKRVGEEAMALRRNNAKANPQPGPANTEGGDLERSAGAFPGIQTKRVGEADARSLAAAQERALGRSSGSSSALPQIGSPLSRAASAKDSTRLFKSAGSRGNLTVRSTPKGTKPGETKISFALIGTSRVQ